MVDMVESQDRINRVRFKYYLNVDEGHQEVCRLCFRRTIAESNDFLTIVLEQRVRNCNSKYDDINKILDSSQIDIYQKLMSRARYASQFPEKNSAFKMRETG